MGKNSKRKTNVKSSIMVLLLIAILLIASTYAWFTSNRTVTISSIDVNVAAQSGIQISVDGINWKTVISNDDITGASATYAAAVNAIPASMTPVSTVGDVSGDRMGMYYGIVLSNDTTGQYELHTADAAENDATSGKYIVFDVFLKVDQDEKLYLTDSSDVTAIDTDKGLKNASRVAFCTLGHAGLDATPETIQALTAGTDVLIWEPNYDVHTQAGVNAASSIYGQSTTLTAAEKLSYYGVKAVIPEASPVLLNDHSEDYFTQITDTLGTKAGRLAKIAESTEGNPKTMGTQELMDLSAGITKFRIYMWIEGQDVDCENTASGSDIRFDLGFTIDPVEPIL